MPFGPRATFDNPYGPMVQFRTEDVLPPSALYVSPQDSLEVAALTNLSGVTIFLALRLMTPQGEVKVELYQAVLQTTSTFTFPISLAPAEGYIIGASIIAQGANTGQCFVFIRLRTGPAPGTVPFTTILMQGYPNSYLGLSYPPTTLQGFFEGAGTINTITQAPAAGQDFVFTVPAFQRWRLISLGAVATTDATVGNRAPVVWVQDAAGNRVVWSRCDSFLAPSASEQFSWGPGLENTSGLVSRLMPLPTYLTLPEGFSIHGSVGAVGAGDQWSNVVLMKEEWVGR